MWHMNEHKKNQKDEQEAAKKSGAEAQKTVTLTQAEYDQLKEQSQKAAENWDKLVRLQAEFENARKRWERDREEYTRYANEELLCEMLNSIDDLERSIELSQQKHEDFTAFLKGVEMILSRLHDMLRRNKVCCMESKGKCFDPHVHEALMQVERDDLPENTVVEEMQKGYMIGNRVLRTAKVQVSRKKTQPKQEGAGNEEVNHG